MNQFKLAMLILASVLLLPSSALAGKEKEKDKGDFDKGKRIYMKNCEICHLIGRNLVNPEKEIQHSKLLDDPKKLKVFLSKKHGIMPPFESLSRDDEQLKDLSRFLFYARRHPSEVIKDEPAKKTETVNTKATVKSASSKSAETNTKSTEKFASTKAKSGSTKAAKKATD